MAYRVLRDYGTYEGMKFEDGEFETIDEAVRAAMNWTGVPFLIVKVVDWQAVERFQSPN